MNVVLHTSEQEARALSREIEATFEAMSDAVFVHDTQEQLRRTNPAAHTIFDLERQPDAPSHSCEEHATLFRFRDEHGQPLSEEHWPLSMESLSSTRCCRGYEIGSSPTMWARSSPFPCMWETNSSASCP